MKSEAMDAVGQGALGVVRFAGGGCGALSVMRLVRV